LSILFFILGIIMFVGLVVLHELGHAIVAKRNGVKVREFGIGFPPKAWSKKLKSGMLLSINWLPLGGFVRLKGEHDAAEGQGTYGGATTWVKAKIILAGVAVNWLMAALIFTIIALFGMPKVFPNQFTIPSDTVVATSPVAVASVTKDSPAQKAGLQEGDVIVSVNNQQITGAEQLIEVAKSNAGKQVTVVYERSGQQTQVDVTLNEQQGTQGYLGVAPQQRETMRSTWSAPIVGVGVTVQFTYETLKGLWQTITQLSQAKFAEAGENVAGPIGIFAILQSSSEVGFVPVLFLIGVISLTLAVMNALPIPALDGGRLFVTLLYRAMRRPLTKEREESIQTMGFLILMLIVVLVTVVDVGRFFR
jgi:regulator of sigma E protease